jgi:hypothetical protein
MCLSTVENLGGQSLDRARYIALTKVKLCFCLLEALLSLGPRRVGIPACLEVLSKLNQAVPECRGGKPGTDGTFPYFGGKKLGNVPSVPGFALPASRAIREEATSWRFATSGSPARPTNAQDRLATCEHKVRSSSESVC